MLALMSCPGSPNYDWGQTLLFVFFTGTRKRDAGLVMPAKFFAFTAELQIARILERELYARAKKYSYFELKNVVSQENKFPLLV